MTFTAKQKRIIRDAVSADSVTFKADGSVVFKRSYFYRMGTSAESSSKYIKDQIETGTTFKVVEMTSEDKWARWPKTSYFVTTMRIA